MKFKLYKFSTSFIFKQYKMIGYGLVTTFNFSQVYDEINFLSSFFSYIYFTASMCV
jgi:hypothetical protein